MTATAVGLSRESFFLGARTAGPMSLFCAWDLFTRRRVDIERTELLAAFPAPGSPAASPNRKAAPRLKSTCKDVVTCRIFQSPALAPRALFCVTAHLL
jgi:hypothetical protein